MSGIVTSTSYTSSSHLTFIITKKGNYNGIRCTDDQRGCGKDWLGPHQYLSLYFSAHSKALFSPVVTIKLSSDFAKGSLEDKLDPLSPVENHWCREEIIFVASFKFGGWHFGQLIPKICQLLSLNKSDFLHVPNALCPLCPCASFGLYLVST